MAPIHLAPAHDNNAHNNAKKTFTQQSFKFHCEMRRQKTDVVLKDQKQLESIKNTAANIAPPEQSSAVKDISLKQNIPCLI